MKAWRRFAMWRRRGQLDHDLQEEMRLHREWKAEQHREAGLPAEEARRRAERDFGNELLLREESTAQWGWTGVEALGQDLRYGLRLLRRSPGFTAVAVVALALGIGANTAVFSVLNAVLLRPLPYAQPDRVMAVLHQQAGPVAPANYLDWRRDSRTMAHLAAAQAWGASVQGSEGSEPVPGMQVTPGMWALLGVAPQIGRTFLPHEDQPGANRVLVLSDGLWRRRFGGDPQVPGRTMTVNGEPHTVVGVMPRQFRFAPFWITDAEMWSPLSLGQRVTDRAGQSLRLFGRLREGVSRQEAQAEFTQLMGRLRAQHPEPNARLEVEVTPAQELAVAKLRPTLTALQVLVGLLLLLACVNVANLLLARSAARRKELAVRLAIGAGRGRLMRQWLTEAGLLAALGGAAGLIVAEVGLRVLTAWLPPSRLPGQEHIGLDGTALAAAGVLSLLTAVVAGLLPAWLASGADVGEALKEGGRANTGSGNRRSTRAWLVAAETALAVVLLVGAGLLARSFVRLQSLEAGFDPDRLLTFTVVLNGTRHVEGERRDTLYTELTRRLQALPGVRAVGSTAHLPIAGDNWGLRMFVEGQSFAPGDQVGATYRVSRPGYFRAMRIPLERGRDFTAQDRAGTPPVVVINEALARRCWPGQEALGKRIATTDPRRGGEWLTVVGVVRNVRGTGWASEPGGELYRPLLQEKDFLSSPSFAYTYWAFAVRTEGDPALLAGAVRSTVWSLDPALTVADVASMEQTIAGHLWRERVTLLLVAIFALIGLVLAGTGVYGVVAHAVVERTAELGVRLALGAGPRTLIRLVVMQGMRPVLLGLAAGVVAAPAVGRGLAGLLYEVRPSDPVTFAGVAAVIAMVALAAHAIPARRAMGLDPLVALRRE